MATLIELTGVQKQYHGEPLLDGLDLRLDDRDRVGLIGTNGSGKSTLLRLLVGTEEPDKGTIVRSRGLRMGYLEQEPTLPAEWTVRGAVEAALGERDEVLRALDRVHAGFETADEATMESLLREQARLDERLEALGGHDVSHRVESTLEHLGLREPDARCGDLSGGELRRVALARLLLAPPDLWLLDEPTNHLDALAIDWLEDFLIGSRTPLLLITHDRYFLDRVVDRVVELEHGKLYESEGGYTAYLKARVERKAKEAHDEDVRANLLRRETAWMRRGPPARTTKSKARIQRYHALTDAAPPDGPGDLVFQIPPGPRLGTRVLSMKGVGHSFGDRVLFSGLDLTIEPGMRLGIVGANGTGKSTLVAIARGILEPTHGQVEWGETVQISSIDQGRADLDEDLTVMEQVGGDRATVRVGDRDVRIETYLDQFLFTGERKRALVRNLSGGERQRVLLAMLLKDPGNLLFLDEPTNDLDLTTMQVLEEALLAFKGSVVVVSHDRWFLDRVATHVLWFEGTGTPRLHEGDVSSLIDRRSASVVAEPAAASTSEQDAKPAKAAKPKASWSSKERNEFRELPARIEQAETKLAALDERLADPSLYEGTGDEAHQLAKEREALTESIGVLYERWEELEARANGA